MVEQDEIIICGPEYTGEEFFGSFAEYLIPKMKSHPKDYIAQVDLIRNENITFHDILKNSLEITEGFIKFGLKEGDVVVFAAPNSIRAHSTALGVMFSGGVFTPIDHNLKSLELQHIIKQFQPKYIICESEKAKHFQSNMKTVNVEAKIILLDSIDNNIDNEFYSYNDIRTEVNLATYTPRKVENPKTSLALISCSSGSTGYPKGVAISHYSLVFNLTLNESLNLTTWHNSFLQTSPLFWVTGIMFLLIGSALCQTRYIPKSTSPEHILEAIEKQKPFFIMLSPAILINLVEHPNFEKYDLKSLKLIVLGGAVLGQEAAEKVKSMWKGVHFVQILGMTEVGGIITNAKVNQNHRTVGTIAPELKVKVVDVETEKSLGPNQIGELRFKSKRIMNGYYNNEEATKDSFDKNGWFRTGDLVYYDEEGLFYVVGRIKEIIKYRNYQISPVEIENFILSLPGVADAAIVPVPDERDSFHLKAVVVKSRNSNVTAEDIIQSVKDNFSDYKHIRKGVEFVSSLPRTETGKLKRVELGKLYGTA